jgi:hypothetical protein
MILNLPNEKFAILIIGLIIIASLFGILIYCFYKLFEPWRLSIEKRWKKLEERKKKLE